MGRNRVPPPRHRVASRAPQCLVAGKASVDLALRKPCNRPPDRRQYRRSGSGDVRRSTMKEPVMTTHPATVRLDLAGRSTARKSGNSPSLRAGMRRGVAPTAIAWMVLALAPCVAAGQTVFFVDGDAPGGGNGASWADAFWKVQDAIAAAAGVGGDVEIRVAERTYKPVGSLDDDRTKTFALRSNLALIGGYAGYGEPDPDARDVRAYETILTGEIWVPDETSDNSSTDSRSPAATPTPSPARIATAADCTSAARPRFATARSETTSRSSAAASTAPAISP